LEPDAPSDDGLNDLLGQLQGQAQNVVQQRLEDYLSGRLSELAALLRAQSSAMRSLAAVALVDPDHQGHAQQAESWSKVAERAKHLLDDAADLDVSLAPAMKATHGRMLAQQPIFASADDASGDTSAQLSWMLEHRFANDEHGAQRAISEIASYQRHASMSDMNLRLQRLANECRRCRTLLATLNAVSALQ
jgi:predicted transcriptional regulator